MFPDVMREALVAAFTRRYPLLSGRGTLANSRVFKSITGAPGDVRWAPVPGGDLLAPLDDYVGRAAYFTGDLDAKLTAICRRFVRPGDVALDIGANLGVITLLLSRLVGPSGRVHAFEPQPRMVELLRRSLERNERRNVMVHDVALGARDAEMALTLCEGNAGAASLVRSVGAKTLRVPVRTLPAYLVAEKRVRFVKIDVEGYELEVLEGARPWIEVSPPDVILFESNDDDDRVFRMLGEMRYRLYALERKLTRLRLRRYRPETPKMGHDFLAVQPGVMS
jgi:FkbM family methyltransferase